MKQKYLYHFIALFIAVVLTIPVIISRISAVTILTGDVDGNQVIDADDALEVLQHAAKMITIRQEMQKAADVTNDGRIDADDALDILKYAARLIDHFIADAETDPTENAATEETPAESTLPEEMPTESVIPEETPEVTESPTDIPKDTEMPATPEPDEDKMPNLKVTIGNSSFRITLYENDAAKELVSMLPMTLNMNELNGNEKYFYFDKQFLTDASRPSGIHTGDLMLYGSDCLVLFYDDFSTVYSYTPLGHMEDTTGLREALGRGDVQVIFEVE